MFKSVIRPFVVAATVIALLVGGVGAVASPAIAHAQPPLSPDPAPATVSDMLSGADPEQLYGLVNANSNKYLWPGESNTVGAVIRQDDFNGGPYMGWTLINDNGYQTFWNRVGSRMNMGIDRASTSPGAFAIQANPSGDTNQDWKLELRQGTNTRFQLKNRKSGLCLGISNASMAPGAPAAQFPCDGRANQTWFTKFLREVS